MRSFLRTLSVALILAPFAPIVDLSAQRSGQQPAAPVETSPFVGTWILNVAKSTYEGIPEDQRRNPSTRTIDVQADGMFIETHRNATTRSQGFFHWVGKPGGPEFPEFGRTSGRAVGNKLTIKINNERQWGVTFRNRDAVVVLTDTWTISPDGKTLTIDRRGTPPNGPPNHSVEVFDNEGWAMPRAR